MSSAEIQEKIVKLKVIRQKVIEGLENELNQRYLYTIPYNEFYLTNSDKPQEVGFSKQDVFVAVKQLEDAEGNIKRLYEIYNNNTEKIAETDENGRIKYDKEITEELVKMKQLLEKKNDEQGTNLKIAGLDDKGEIEAYIRMYQNEIISLTAKQKEEMDNNKLDDKNKKLENVKDEKAMNANDKNELKTMEIANDLGIDPQDIYQITEIKDDTFLRSEGIKNANELSAIKTRDGSLQIVTKNAEGKFEKSKDFGEGTKETGRTTYVTNNYNNMKETNTYGAISFNNDPNKRIAARMGTYGEIELIKQERVTSNPDGHTMSNEETWSPGVLVQTDNTARGDMDLDGEYSRTKRVFNKMERDNLRMNEESTTIREHGGENLTVQDIADDSTRGIATFEKVQVELNNRGIEMTEEDKERIKQSFIEKGTTFCQEEVEEFCDKYEAYKKQQEENEQTKKEDKDKDSDDSNERTLAGDALERRRRNM